jgi:hypothetical protein
MRSIAWPITWKVSGQAVWVERFDELSGALEDLVEGKLAAILKPEIPKI